MGSAREIITQFAKIEGTRYRGRRFVESVPCANCRGIGLVPRYDNVSRCPVFGATGKVVVVPPVINSSNYSGSGRKGGDLRRLACRGTRIVSVGKEAAPYLKCNGAGEQGSFNCTFCKGQGIV